MNDKTVDKSEEKMDTNETIELNSSLTQLDDSLRQMNLSDGSRLGEGTSIGRVRPHSQRRVYAKDSMDRFGDDMVELILSYLAFSDKVSLEAVSSQWQRVIYCKQFELEMNRSDTEEHNTLNKLLKEIDVVDYATGFAQYAGFKAIDKPSLKSLLIKCPYIKKVNLQCYTDADDLDIIGKYCPHLKSLECNPIGLKEKTLSEFGHKYGHKLEIMRFNDSNYCSPFLKKFLKFCPNLKEVYTEENSAYISSELDFLPQLETIKSIDIRTEQLDQLRILADKYSHTMKNIKIYTYHMIGHQLKNAIAFISHFENLESLGLFISLFDEDMQSIDENVAEITRNCTKLKKLNFTVNNESVISTRFFYSLSKLLSIEKLSLEFYEMTKKLDGTVDCFRHCSKLKHLVISYKELTEDFFANIQTALPDIRVLDINSDQQMTDNFITSLSKLQSLKKLVIRNSANAYKDITDQSMCELLTGCPNIENIVFSARPNITQKTIDTLIAVAAKRPRTKISFSCGFSAAGDEHEFPQIDVNSFADRMPQNLKISIDLGQVLEQNEQNE